MTDRVYAADAAGEEALVLRGDEARHLVRVRRAKPGQMVEVFDGRGHAFQAQVTDLGRDHVALKRIGSLRPDRAAPRPLTLATAVPKGDRVDWLVEKATELGVSRLVPLVTARSVVEPRAAKLDRLRRLVVEACKQCGRNRLMAIDPPTPWPDLVRARRPAVGWLAHPEGEPASRWPDVPRGQELLLAIGPEGGFTGDEVDEAQRAGWRLIGLGPTILRIETAALVGAALVLNRGVSS